MALTPHPPLPEGEGEVSVLLIPLPEGEGPGPAGRVRANSESAIFSNYLWGLVRSVYGIPHSRTVPSLLAVAIRD